MTLAFLYPVRRRRPFDIPGEFLGQSLGIDFQLATGGGQRIMLGVFIESPHADRFLLPIGMSRDDIIAFFAEFLPADQILDAGSLKTPFDLLLDSLTSGELLE